MKNIFLIFMLALCVSSTAEIPGFDGHITLKVAPYAIEITGKHKFCIQRILYKGYAIGKDSGYYGTILANGKAKFIGAGHNEGGEEKVQSFKVLVDGKPVEFKKDAVLSGSKIEYHKVSIQDNLKVYVNLSLTKDGIRIDKNFEALDKQNIYSFYIFQYCWSNKTEAWLIGRPNGTFGEGVFKSNKGWHLLRERELLWYSLFDPQAAKGILGYFISYHPRQGRYMLWDKTVYHKFYYWANLPKIVPKGMKSRKYSMLLKGFEAQPANWKKDVKALAVKLEKQYPLPKTPENTVYNFDDQPGKILEVKGNGKFVCKKLPANLKAKKKYKITFKIKKSPRVSKISSDNYLIVGQHDKKRKFQIFGSFGSRIPRDNKWHEIAKTFETPAVITVGNIYIYNKRTQASIWVDNLKIILKD
jgi:hypothetical protein